VLHTRCVGLFPPPACSVSLAEFESWWMATQAGGASSVLRKAVDYTWQVGGGGLAGSNTPLHAAIDGSNEYLMLAGSSITCHETVRMAGACCP
jgi:hypothetical protein